MAQGKQIIINGLSFGFDKSKQLLLTETLKTVDNDSPIESSVLGTPIYDNIVLGNIAQQNTYFNILGETKSFPGLKMNQVLIEVSGSNNVVTQPIQGRDGTIKQYISKGDFNILITGTISGKYNSSTGKWNSAKSVGDKYHPKEELRLLVDICKAGYSIPVISDFLNDILGIDNLVITDYNIPQQEGGRYSQVFEINALSDKEDILDFTEEQVNDNEQLRTILGV